MERFKLYQELKKSGFPQGGSGQFIVHPETEEKVYVPHPGEIYNQFLANPDKWEGMVDVMTRVWIDNNK